MKNLNDSLNDDMVEDLDSELENFDNTSKQNSRIVTSESLGLMVKKLNIKFCEYKISNIPGKMLSGECTGISIKGLSFLSSVSFSNGGLLRIWVEIPNFWNLKSKLVNYSHTEAPEYFQLLARTTKVEETNKRQIKYSILAETVNLDPADEKLLNDFLHVIPQKAKRSSSSLSRKVTL